MSVRSLAHEQQGPDEAYRAQRKPSVRLPGPVLEGGRAPRASGLSDEAVERIIQGTAPLLFDRDVDLKPVVAEFNDYLEDLKAEKIGEHKEKNCRFI